MPNLRGRGRWSRLPAAPPLLGAPLASRPFPGPAPPGTPVCRSASLTLATRIIRLATSRSPWWFWPISAMIKHGCCPPTQRPGHSSSSSGIAAARAPAPLGPPGSGRHRLWSVESAAQQVHTSTPPRQPGPPRGQSSGPASLSGEGGGATRWAGSVAGGGSTASSARLRRVASGREACP